MYNTDLCLYHEHLLVGWKQRAMGGDNEREGEGEGEGMTMRGRSLPSSPPQRDGMNDGTSIVEFESGPHRWTTIIVFVLSS